MFHNAFMMKRRAVDRVGFFDEESFPIFLSEADYSERIRRLGYSVLVVPSAKVWHDVPPPRSGISLRAMHITDPVRAYFVARNRIILMWRYRKVSEFLAFFLLFEPVIVTVQLLSIILSQIPEKAAIATGYIKGILDGVRKGFPMRRLHIFISQE
jgi:GT2 family glycosyltransferase